MFAFIACNMTVKKETINAEITERRMLDNGRLLLTYSYKYNSILFTGTKEVENKPLPANILRVSFPAKNPLKSSILLP